MPQETKSSPASPVGGVAAAESSPTLQGLAATREDEAALRDALEKAFDYRGDVTITRTDGTVVTGYVFDRVEGRTLDQCAARLLPADGSGRITIPFRQIARLEFTGKDAAHGKTFENWVKRYVEKKLAGEKASIESEALD